MTPKQFLEILKQELKPLITETVEPILNEALQPVLKTQDSILKTQDSILKTQDSILKTQDSILKTQETHTRKIDALTADMHVVQKLAETTVDIVKARYERNKREIDEIKDHLGLPKGPHFAE